MIFIKSNLLNELNHISKLFVSGIIVLLFLYSSFSDYKFKNEHVYEKAGVWLNDNYSDKDYSISLVEIGFVGFYSDLYVIDILGLVNHKNAEFVSNKELTKWLDYYHADLILLHEPLWNLEKDTYEEALKRGYILDKSFNFDGLQLLVLP